MKHHNLIGLGLVILAAAGAIFWTKTHEPSKLQPATLSSSQSTASKPTDSKTPPESFNKQLHSTDDPASIWVVVNKKHPLNPKTYIPADLSVPNVRLRLNAKEEQMKFRKIAQNDLKDMFEAAKKAGVSLVFGSGYRSYNLQKQFYDSYVAKDGQAKADTYSARPGYSEHQTGLALDFTSPDRKCHLEICWENSPEGQWVAANAHMYGFIMRYTSDKQEVTGYQYEPWHFRYVGRELAAEMHKQNVTTLEEFFGVSGGTSY